MSAHRVVISHLCTVCHILTGSKCHGSILVVLRCFLVEHLQLETGPECRHPAVSQPPNHQAHIELSQTKGTTWEKWSLCRNGCECGVLFWCSVGVEEVRDGQGYIHDVEGPWSGLVVAERSMPPLV